MYKALTIKELRDCAGILALSLLAFAWLLCGCMGINILPMGIAGFYERIIPFVGGTFVNRLSMIGGALAIAMALKQSAWESFHDTYYFLLHRPISVRRIITVKLAIGLVSVLFIASLSILLYAFWAAKPGNTPTPFQWGMTHSSWAAILALPGVYLGAFVSGIRPAKWFGTRLVPLLGAIAAGVASSTLLTNERWWLLGAMLFPTVCVVCVLSIFFYAETRDY